MDRGGHYDAPFQALNNRRNDGQSMYNSVHHSQREAYGGPHQPTNSTRKPMTAQNIVSATGGQKTQRVGGSQMTGGVASSKGPLTNRTKPSTSGVKGAK